MDEIGVAMDCPMNEEIVGMTSSRTTEEPTELKLDAKDSSCSVADDAVVNTPVTASADAEVATEDALCILVVRVSESFSVTVGFVDGNGDGIDSTSEIVSGRTEDAGPTTASDAAGTSGVDVSSKEETNDDTVAEALEADTANDFDATETGFVSPLLSSLTFSQIF